jgi:ubiquinol-cytochrome c reductase cytochrome b subunit
MQAGSPAQTWTARILTVFYFGFFLTMPIWSAMGQTKEVPARVPDHD